MWVALIMAGLLCAVFVTAAVLDLKARRRGRRAHIANPFEHGYHPQPCRETDFPTGGIHASGRP